MGLTRLVIYDQSTLDQDTVQSAIETPLDMLRSQIGRDTEHCTGLSLVGSGRIAAAREDTEEGVRSTGAPLVELSANNPKVGTIASGCPRLTFQYPRSTAPSS